MPIKSAITLRLLCSLPGLLSVGLMLSCATEESQILKSCAAVGIDEADRAVLLEVSGLPPEIETLRVRTRLNDKWAQKEERILRKDSSRFALLVPADAAGTLRVEAVGLDADQCQVASGNMELALTPPSPCVMPGSLQLASSAKTCPPKLPPGCAARPCILLVADDRGEISGGTPTAQRWEAAVNRAGFTVSTVNPMAANPVVCNRETEGGDPGSLLGWDLVIWETGTQAYANLSATNIKSLTDYLDSGGRLLYGGAHCLYDEPNAKTAMFAEQYLGLSPASYGQMPEGSFNGQGQTGDPLCPSNLNFVPQTNLAPSSCSGWGAMMAAFIPAAGDVQGCYAIDSKPSGDMMPPTRYLVARRQAKNYRLVLFGFNYGEGGHLAKADGDALMQRALSWLLRP